jgi:hypothetical protein
MHHENRSGEIAATVLIASKPTRCLKPEDGLHLLPVSCSGALGSELFENFLAWLQVQKDNKSSCAK